MKTLWMELQRWNNSRVLVCDVCGRFPGRIRADLAPFMGRTHAAHAPAHTVKARRFG